eukprot:3830043-Amphidinium_carterae.1
MHLITGGRLALPLNVERLQAMVPACRLAGNAHLRTSSQLQLTVASQNNTPRTAATLSFQTCRQHALFIWSFITCQSARHAEVT